MKSKLTLYRLVFAPDSLEDPLRAKLADPFLAFFTLVLVREEGVVEGGACLGNSYRLPFILIHDIVDVLPKSL